LAQRIQADVVQVVSLEKELLLDTLKPELSGTAFPSPNFITKAEENEALESQSFVFLDQKLYAIVVTPLRAPDPKAWICVGFEINHTFAKEIQSYSDLEISFLHEGPEKPVLASTFDDKEMHASLVAAIKKDAPVVGQKIDLDLAGTHFISYLMKIPTESGDNALVVLQRSLDKQLAPYLRLERTLLLLAATGLVVSITVGGWIAKNVSEPILQLAEGATRIEQGDYDSRVMTTRRDEIGTLASAFNHMSQGLAERDRVRSLLGKVVSPAIAAELMRKEITLGGEMRKVTILFSDIRNFTAMCERLKPEAMLDVLNLYFTRMSTIIEAHGGVVDKYVGDAIMALFGAPLSYPDDADRALASALEMSDALDQLNRQWQAEGHSALGIGIGINTDAVIAGNMGSQTRLNYTVIGDGVNVASRLENLTKTPEYNTRIIVGASTLAEARGKYQTRPLGEVTVKGKQTAVAIFALTGKTTDGAVIL
jgi:adenylate cyclase